MSKKRLKRKKFDREIETLQIELCRLQAWTKETGARIVVIFEGRDAAGKGGVIKRITERVSPRVFRVVALPTPTEREKSQLFIQRYVQHLPAAGEIVLFDRSWYNRAGVEHVMGFCSQEEYENFINDIPKFENAMVGDGIILIKYFFDISPEVQEERFKRRINDARKHWKLSSMDVESWSRWSDYTIAYRNMIEKTHTEQAPWFRVPANEKRSARLNCISHLLSCIPYEAIPFESPILSRQRNITQELKEIGVFSESVPRTF